MTASRTTYSTVAITFHWVIAIMLVSMVFYGWWMEDLRANISGPEDFAAVQAAYNWHKTAGITILILSLARLAWRFTHPAPPLPAHMKP